MRGAELGKTNPARRLRRNSTIAEQRMWNKLRSRGLSGMKSFGRADRSLYADFVCRERRLVVEIDGGQHAVNQRDCTRDEWLCGQGYKILRFWNNDVMQNIEGVLVTIANSLRAESAPSPGPRQGEDRPLPASGAR
jgi:very-short-patch-repair endonuclease